MSRSAGVADGVQEQLEWDGAERESRAEQGSFHNQPPASEMRGHYSQVFVQCVNMWKHNPLVRKLVLDPRLGALAAAAAQCDAVRLYHDHALIKQPWAPATNWYS
jgi:hypothetical protein